MLRFTPALFVALVLAVPSVAAQPVEFRLSFDACALNEPFTGRVFVLLTKTRPDPVSRNINWFNPEPTFARDVKEWKPGEPLTLGTDSLAYPMPLTDVKPGKYFAQAVMDRDLGGISFSASPGNIYSEPVTIEIGQKQPDAVLLTLNQVYREPIFKQTDSVKLIEIESQLLSRFHGRPTKLRAGVVLPSSFVTSPDRKYPVVYEVTGFGGDHRMAFSRAAQKAWQVDDLEMLWVVLDGNCRLGHHVFADSANNGPVGTALVEELIPAIEKNFRGLAKPGARFVTGHSSGGWSSLWLQVAYPNTFGGCWSTSPDPVDFRDFQRVNLYAAEANLFMDDRGERRALSRPHGNRRLFYKTFSDMEVLMGRGGQLGSFEAVFSPRGTDGKPRELWDRKNGLVHRDVVKAWEQYDIRLKLEREWKGLGPMLTGKIHLYMGEEDTFYLDGASRLLKASLSRLGSDAVVELFPKKNHALVDSTLRRRLNQEMAAKYRTALRNE